jgi:hypothetical protein
VNDLKTEDNQTYSGQLINNEKNGLGILKTEQIVYSGQ